MMKLCVKCENHYDDARNEECPYCTKDASNSLFGGDKTEVYNGTDLNSEEINTVSWEDAPSDDIYEKIDNTDDSDKTVVFNSNKSAGEESLVVGWFVIIEGKGKGKDLRITSGQNSIGRGSSNMITVDFGDNSISREKHAFIIYDPKHKKFIFKSGEGQNISYLNDEGVYGPTEIKNGDIVEIGETKMMFVQLCGESFQWN